MMKTRTLGKTGLQVSELSLGGLFVSNFGGEFEGSRAAVLRALELGVNYIDTAPGYGNSEEVLGRILAETVEPVILSTKLGGRPTPFLPQDKACLRQSVEESLRLLGRDKIDLLMVHEPDRPGQYDWWPREDDFTGPVTELLGDLKSEGIVGHTGVGGTTAYEMARVMRSGAFDVVLTAFNYSLLWREAELEILPAARELGMGVVVGSPLQQGALARRFDDEVNSGAYWLSPPRRRQFQQLYALLDETGMSIAEVGIRFVLSNPQVSCVLMGARSAAEVEANVEAASKGPLDPAIVERLDAIAAQVPFRPFGEPAGLPFGRSYRGPGLMA